MMVSDIMTSPVKTVGIMTPVQEIAALLAGANISGVPVVDAKGGLVGIVSEADLMGHNPGATGRWWLAGLSSPDAVARAFVKAHGQIAADIMTKHIVTVRHDATLAEVGEVLTVHGIKRLPVTRAGKLVGIVTRRDLVRAFAQAGEPPVPTIGNAHLQKALLERLAQEPWLDASYINVLVRKDVIELSGYVSSAEQKRAVEALVSELDQTRRIVDMLEIGIPLVSDFT